MNSESGILTDSDLVIRCIDGNRDAFRQLVERYQSLVCSLAYAGCGDLHLSEEIAQETFLTAWRKLGNLKDPSKCKSWLCGIARNLTQNTIRRRSRTMTAAAEPLDETTHSPEGSPHEHAVSREEEAILWSALEALPENYREPMILFYRESDSVAAVADALEISEDAVKQRLSRGRAMLAEHIARSLRAALRASAPGKFFTLGVLAAVSAISVSAKAASLGSSAAKGATAKTALATGIFGALLGPVLMLLGNYVSYRIGMESACTDRERSLVRRLYIGIFAIVTGFVAIIDVLIFWGNRHAQVYPGYLAATFVALALACTGSAAVFMVWSFRERRRLIGERVAAGITLEATVGIDWEYRSRFELLGLPFIHLRIGDNFGWEPVKAWIAAGNCAFGLLFAFGGVALAPVCVGGLAVGLLCWGGFAAGLFALGGFSLGWWAVGGMAFGWKTFAGCSVAWRGAMGGVAVAHDFANGGFAYAAHANNRIAFQWFRARAFFRDTAYAGEHMQWLNLLWVLPLLQWWHVLKKRRKQWKLGRVP